MPQIPLDFRPLQGFEARDFVVSAPNLDAFTTLQAWPGPQGGAIALVGAPGTGKSHLSALWAARLKARRLRPDFRPERLGDAPGHILVEDVDAGFRDETLFHLINLGKRPGCGLLLTGWTAPSLWEPKIADLRSRLNAMPVLVLEAPDDAILEGMLQKFFRQRHIRPTQDLLDYLVRRIERSAVAAETAVERLHAAASAAGRSPRSRREGGGIVWRRSPQPLRRGGRRRVGGLTSPSTKLSRTRFSPAFSKFTVSLLPSTMVTAP